MIDSPGTSTLIVAYASDFDGWREQARQLLKAGIPPARVTWRDGSDRNDDLFSMGAESLPIAPNAPTPTIARAHLQALSRAARYRTQPHEIGRWPLLYQTLWRLSRGDETALNAADETGAEVQRRQHAVKREAHHLHAFLRFHPDADARGECFVAWFEPAHEVLDLGAEHFADRLGSARFRIATPQGGVEWNGEHFTYHATCPREWRARAQSAASADEDRALWRTYFVSTFNPARLNHKVMTQHMPQRFWRHLSEGDLIPALEAKARHGGQRLAQEASVGERKGKALPPARPERDADA
ncbi:TIGR03915 family putative DNA repair protein [Salinicola aestuarinus]|uniref:TIGR03915 family putative DNA repair protein n=1 Tax=Salinicola aestuarinus TaxID=1949082 RepID=UPI000DA22A4E|nr:TIGR03915 family putative DNA repair protein [Salinicola aestuarinus]